MAEPLRTASALRTDQSEQFKKGIDAWKENIAVVDFFFTRCPGICPRMTLNLQRVQRAYEKDTQVAINSFTVDPEHDSIAELKKYATRRNINTRNRNFFIGIKTNLYKLAGNKLMIVATDGDGRQAISFTAKKLVAV